MTHVSTDDRYERYLFDYRFNGAEWGIEIKAASPAEARERLKAIAWAQYKGRVYATVPAVSGPLARIAAFLRNVLNSLVSDSPKSRES